MMSALLCTRAVVVGFWGTILKIAPFGFGFALIGIIVMGLGCEDFRFFGREIPWNVKHAPHPAMLLKPNLPPTSSQCHSRHGHATCLLKNACMNISRSPPVIILDPADRKNSDHPLSVERVVSSQLGLKASTASKRFSLSRVETDQSWPKVHETTVVVWRYEPESWANVLGDEVWPAFQALTLWGQNVSTARILNDKRTPQLDQFGLVTDGRIQTHQELQESLGPVVCFDTLVVGVAKLGYSMGNTCTHHRDMKVALECREDYLPEFRASMGTFRAHAMRKQGLSERKPLHQLSILLMDNFTDYTSSLTLVFSIENYPELVHELESRFPAAKVLHCNWNALTPRQQVQIMSSADIVVSVSSLTLVSAVWLPPYGEIISPCLYSPNTVNPPILNWFQYSHYVQPVCNTDETTLCNGVITLNIPSMVERISNAVDRLVVTGWVSRDNLPADHEVWF